MGPHGLRAGWRILLWALVAFPFYVATSSAALALGGAGSLLGGFAAMLVAAVLAGWVMLYGVDRRRPGALGFAADPAAPRELGVGFLAGGAILGAAVLLLAVAGTARWVADGGTAGQYAAVLGQLLLVFTVAAAAEEAVFRGYAFHALVQGIGAWPAALVTSALFAGAHVANANATPLGIANIFLAGVMLAVAYLRTRSLWFATAVHVGWNWTMSALLDFPVSGLQLDTPLYDARETGADWWTGGAFGPEAGVAATLAVVAGTAWLLRTRRLGESPRMRELRPLVDARLEEGWPRTAPR